MSNLSGSYLSNSDYEDTFSLCPTDVFQSISTSFVSATLKSVTSYIDSKVGTRYQVPLAVETHDIQTVVSYLADWRLMTKFGYKMDEGTDKIFLTNYSFAMKWLDDVSNGSAIIDAKNNEVPDTESNETNSVTDIIPYAYTGRKSWGLY